MYPFVMLLSSLISLINLGLIVYVAMSLLIAFEILNKHQPIVARVYYTLQRLFEPLLKPIRKLLPPLGGIDLSPILLIILLNFLERAVIYYMLGETI